MTEEKIYNLRSATFQDIRELLVKLFEEVDSDLAKFYREETSEDWEMADEDLDEYASLILSELCPE